MTDAPPVRHESILSQPRAQPRTAQLNWYHRDEWSLRGFGGQKDVNGPARNTSAIGAHMGENLTPANRPFSEEIMVPGGPDVIVIGDSLAEGRGDPREHGGFGGWAWQLAQRLGVKAERFVSMGRYRATTSEIADHQLSVLTGARCRLVAVACGTNDVLGDVDLSLTALKIDMIISAAVAGCSDGDLHTAGSVAALTASVSVQRQLGERFAELNALLRRVSRTYGAGCLDLCELADVTNDAMWAEDRIHPSPRGHDLIAAGFAELLQERAFQTVSVPMPATI